MELPFDRCQVDIIIIDNSLEVNAISTVLESFGMLVRRHFVGHVRQLMTLLSQPNDLYDTLIICCHGSREGIILPELDAELEKHMPYQRLLTDRDLNHFLNVDNKLVIITGCCLGQQKFSHAFLNGGAKTYLAPNDYIEANDCLIFIINFIYYHLIRKMTNFDAHQRTLYYIDEESDLCLFKLAIRNKIHNLC